MTDLVRDQRSECRGKEGFATKPLALKIANKLGGAVAYRCRFCGLFHVGGSKKTSHSRQSGRRR